MKVNPVRRVHILEVLFSVILAAMIFRAGQIQLAEGSRWAEAAESQLLVREPLPARRGTIFDRHGEPLAITHEYYHVGVAPTEITGLDSTARILARHLKRSTSSMRADLRSGKSWLYYRGPYTGSQVEPLRALAGVHLEPELLRFHPSSHLARPLLGGLDGQGRAVDGLELSMDSVLAGSPGEAVLLRDSRGRRYPSPGRRVDEPISGFDIYLTLDAELQDIAERGLEDVIERFEASAGDVVFLDPATGELLAVASLTARGTTASPSAITTTFEPGSTAKLFTAAALLVWERVDSSVRESAEGGRWRMPLVEEPTRASHWRVIEDSHEEDGTLNLAEAVQVSSNIVMAKLSQRLTPVEQYETLRAFGFGSPTGIEFPSESRGALRYPQDWRPSRGSRASIAMGYEFAVTPLQMAVAYGAIANGGILLTPTLVKEIRDPDGQVVYRHHPEPVRRAVSEEIASKLRHYLRSAAGDGGTGGRGQLENYPLSGKTGTARISEGGRYINAHRSSFAALFPGDDPQLVVIVKVDRSRRGYYGSEVAAPVVRRMLNEALASRRIAIDRSRLIELQGPSEASASNPPTKPVDLVPPSTVARSWPLDPTVEVEAEVRTVPRVVGLGVRDAMHELHQQGYQVFLRGVGERIVQSSPADGESLVVGRTVVVWTN